MIKSTSRRNCDMLRIVCVHWNDLAVLNSTKFLGKHKTTPISQQPVRLSTHAQITREKVNTTIVISPCLINLVRLTGAKS